MRYLIVLLFVLASNLTNSQVFAQSACTPEQLRDRYKPIVPAKQLTEHTWSCPPQYELVNQSCVSPVIRVVDQIDNLRGTYHARNASGQTLIYQDEYGSQWHVEQHDEQGRPSAIRQPDASVVTLTWSGENIASRTAEGDKVLYSLYDKSGLPRGLEVQGIGWMFASPLKQGGLDWSHIESSGGAGTFVMDFGGLTAGLPTPPPSVSTMGAAATPVPLRLFVFSFPVVNLPPVVAIGMAGAGGLYVGSAIYPLIEPALSPIIDACAAAVDSGRECRKAANALLNTELAACKEARSREFKQWLESDKQRPAGQPRDQAWLDRINKAFGDCNAAAFKKFSAAIAECFKAQE